jgi:hypothetical protein
MGRTPLSGWPLLWQLRRAGLATQTFRYSATRETFVQVARRLTAKVAGLLDQGDELVLVGHSLGGVLLREALSRLDPGHRPPRHLFLLGSPVGASRMAQRMAANPVFRAATRDFGHLLGSPARMSAIGKPPIRTTGIAGTRGLAGTRAAFGAEPNDGVVSLSEVSAEWLDDQVLLPVVHTLLPSSSRVASIILRRLDLRD